MATPAQFLALFEPRGVVVAGASSHPGKFGFVALHNILAAGYGGEVFATNREAIEVLGVQTLASLDDVPDGAADLVFVCTPAATNPELLRTAASKGITAAFIASAGYGEAGDEGRRAQDELVALADDLGMLIVGPNGQGVVSTPANLCAQIVAPYPPRGRIGIASQSGNFVSSFMNYAQASGVGVSRAVSAGNAAQVGVSDFLEFYADDPETDVALAYVEGIEHGRDFFERLRSVCQQIPVVIVKGGATAGGSRAAASHTGSLATNDRVFDGMCRQAGALRAPSIEAAYELAATFATQPAPTGGRVVVMTTAGGWGVVTADAISSSRHLDLLVLPDDLRVALDAELPPRWSRNNPVDLAGGETKDTIPTVLGLVAEHPAVDAVVLLGMGIQGNQAQLERSGGFYPDHGLERIVAFHERQEARYAQAAAELSARLGKPIMMATELAVTAPDNAAVAAVRERGRYCYPSSNRAVAALDALVARSRWQQRHG
jgi:acetyltransferase